MLENLPLLLTFDLEEFDIPLEYGQNLALSEQMAVSLEGLNKLLPILDKHHVKATFFTTAHWALHHPDVVQQLAEKHEIACHAYFHSRFDEKERVEVRFRDLTLDVPRLAIDKKVKNSIKQKV